MFDKVTYIQVDGDILPYEKAMRRAQGVTRQSGTKIKSEFASIASSIKSYLGPAAIAYGVYKISSASIQAASDLEEVDSKFHVVFDGQISKAEEWSKTLVDGYAMSEREAKKNLAALQDLLVPMGMYPQKAAEMSFETVKLAADLGSFNNLQTEQVMDDIQSALVGNYETMKKYGVVLNATVVQQKALDMGLANNKKSLTAAHKAQAAYQLIVEGSAAAIGDYARTSNSYANASKKLTSQIEMTSAALGESLLPAATESVKALTALLKKTEEGVKSGNLVTMARALGLATEGTITFGQAMQDGRKWVEEFDKNASVARINAEIDQTKQKIKDLQELTSKDWFFFTRSAEEAKLYTDQIGILSAEMMKLIEKRNKLSDYQATLPPADKEELGEEAAPTMATLTEEEIKAQQELEHLLIMTQLEAQHQREEAAAEHYAELDRLHQESIERERTLDRMRLQNSMAVANSMGAIAIAGAQILGAEGKKMFAFQKAVQIGLAVMAAHTAAAMALAQPPGPPATIPNAAAALKLGYWNVAAIAAQAIAQAATSSGSGSSGGSSGGAVGTYNASPTSGLPVYGDEKEEKGSLTIIIEGDMIGNPAYIDSLVEQINKAQDTRDVTLRATTAREAEAIV